MYMSLLSILPLSKEALSCGPGGALAPWSAEWNHLGTYLQEAVDEVVRQPGRGLLLGTEVLEHVRQLLPKVEGFLDM